MEPSIGSLKVSDDTSPASMGAEDSPDSASSETDRDTLLRSLVQHRTRLYRFIVKNIGNVSEAEDLVQQAFLEAVKSYENFHGQSKLSTWLYGIAMNLVRNYLSRAPHRRYDFVDDSSLDEHADSALTPAQAAEESQRMRHLQTAIADLPQNMREILLMVAVDEISYDEAASLLDVPVGTVRSRLSRARTALRAKLEARGCSVDL